MPASNGTERRLAGKNSSVADSDVDSRPAVLRAVLKMMPCESMIETSVHATPLAQGRRFDGVGGGKHRHG